MFMSCEINLETVYISRLLRDKKFVRMACLRTTIHCSSLLSETNQIRIFVLDEADEMLSRGFKDQIYDVFRLMPQSTQVHGLL